jgi:hypothetical protein
MHLRSDWRFILRRAWSIRLLILAGLLSGLETALSLWGGGTLVPPGAFAALSGVVTAAAFVARLVAQKGFPDA